MSVAIGVPCNDGVVLACDQQYTIGFTKVPGPKMFAGLRYYRAGAHNAVLIVATDNAESGKKLSQVIIESLPNQFTREEFVIAAETALRQYLEQYIVWMPEDEQGRLHSDFLIAVRCGNECHLYRANGSMLVHQDEAVCIGEGLYLGNYLLARLLPRAGRYTEAVGQIVAHIISAVSDYVTSAGKGTTLNILQVDGEHTSILMPEREIVETHIEEAFQSFADALGCCDGELSSELSLNLHIERLRHSIISLRAAHEKRIERRLLMERFATAKAVQHPQSTTNDQSPQPPSQESPGGSGGS